LVHLSCCDTIYKRDSKRTVTHNTIKNVIQHQQWNFLTSTRNRKTQVLIRSTYFKIIVYVFNNRLSMFWKKFNQNYKLILNFTHSCMRIRSQSFTYEFCGFIFSQYIFTNTSIWWWPCKAKACSTSDMK
jgi:hypothetical protein